MPIYIENDTIKNMKMQEIRSPDKRLIFSVDAKNKVVERLEKGWKIRIEFKNDGTMTVQHYKIK